MQYNGLSFLSVISKSDTFPNIFNMKYTVIGVIEVNIASMILVIIGIEDINVAQSIGNISVRYPLNILENAFAIDVLEVLGETSIKIKIANDMTTG